MPDTPISPNVSDLDEEGRPSTFGRYVGRTLDNRYQIVRLLGRGGMGSVFLARHVVLGKPLAVKLLHAPKNSKHQEYTRLFREAQTAAQIGHPNIIDVLDVGVSAEGHPYLVMEYLEGEDVASILRRQQAIGLAAACAITEPVLLALGAAHARNIVHRDIKPANIFVVGRRDAPPTVKLIDFGIAKELGPTRKAGLTLPGALLGTPSYMPPEQATGVEDVDTRADIYGVGISLYEMLTGKLPFEGQNYNETLFRIVTDEAPKPVSPLQELPEDLVAIIERAMHKDPASRFQSAADFLEALKRIEAWSSRASAFETLALTLETEVPSTESIASTQLSPESPVLHGAKAPARAKPPSDFVQTVADGASLQPRRQSVSVSSNAWFLGSVAIVSISTLLFLVWRRTPNPPEEVVSPPSAIKPHPAPRERVSIRLEGAPPGASVLFDGKPVTKNPVVIDTSNTVVSVRVEKPGFEPYETLLVPIRNTTLRVAMQPVLAPEPAPAPSQRAPEKARPRNAPQRKTKALPADANVEKSGRGTFYTEKFE